MSISTAVPAGGPAGRRTSGALPVRRRPSAPLTVGVALGVALGAAARIVAYAARRSIWTDEAALAHDILHRSWSALAAPLDFAQVAPVGFLWLEKGVTSLFGPSEWALRLIPFLAALAALGLFVLVARRVLAPAGAVVATALFATAPQLVYFASETKQFSSDAAIALAIVLAALQARDRGLDARRAGALGLGGALAPFVSQPSLFVLAGAAIFLLGGLRRAGGRTRARHVALTLALWGAGGAIAAIHALHSVSAHDRAYLEGFWATAFLPIGGGTAAWLARFATEMGTWLFPAPWGWLVLALVALGIGTLAHRRDGTLTLLLAPLAIALLASALRLYPMAARVTLFIVPALLLTAGAGAEWLVRVTRQMRLGRPAAWGGLAVLVAGCIASLRYVMLTREEIRPVMRWVAAHRQPGDAVYVYYGAARAFEFYAPSLGFARGDYRLGRCSRADWHGYIEDLDALRGRDRVWLVLAHPFHKAGIDEDSLFLGYLARIGRPLATVSAPGALARLYDLGDTTRARAAAAGFSPQP
ncbi:MAG TPA: glycosyltransferase family 39 protein, partial [Gemmatimonadaceae bacterium]|nr:glycosyltransferase family 39 protein [Gemmatimonadaceae bacterium]